MAPKAFLEGRDVVRNKLHWTLHPHLQSCHKSTPPSSQREEKIHTCCGGTEPIQPHWLPSWPEADLMGSRGWDKVSVLCVEGQDQQAGGMCRSRARRVRKQPEQSGSTNACSILRSQEEGSFPFMS